MPAKGPTLSISTIAVMLDVKFVRKPAKSTRKSTRKAVGRTFVMGLLTAKINWLSPAVSFVIAAPIQFFARIDSNHKF